MYVQGVSTRKVKAVTEELCGHSFSASSISALAKTLDGSLKAFAERRLAEAFPYLILDARYERVRDAGVIVSQAVLIAVAVGWEGRRQTIGVGLASRASRWSWRDFLQALKGRGLHGVELVVSDDHAAKEGDPGDPAGGGLAALLRPLPAQCPRLRAPQGGRRLPAGTALVLRPPRTRRGPPRHRSVAG